MIVETSGWRIHRARLLRGMTVEQLGSMAEVGFLSLVAAEGDAWPLVPEQLSRVAAVLGVDEAELLPGNAEQQMRDLIHRSGYHTACGLECDVVRGYRTTAGLRALDARIAEQARLSENSAQL